MMPIFELVWTEVDPEERVSYQLWIMPEDLQVRGNAMCSDDPAEDRRVENHILARLAAGETWAWALVKCVASKDAQRGVDYLGGCSYLNTADFIQPGGYWDDMKAAALADMLRPENRARTHAVAQTIASTREKKHA